MLTMIRSVGRVARITAVAALTLFATACKDPLEHGHGEEVAQMRITITGQAPVTVASNGTASGSLAIATGLATSVSVEFLAEDGDEALGEHADDFEATITPGAGITFTRTGPFAGTLTGAAAGSVAVQFGLFHLEEGHHDFGPFPVTVSVNDVAP